MGHILIAGIGWLILGFAAAYAGTTFLAANKNRNRYDNY